MRACCSRRGRRCACQEVRQQGCRAACKHFPSGLPLQHSVPDGWLRYPPDGARTGAPVLLAPAPCCRFRLCYPAGGAATEVPRYLVAEDFFAACSEEMRCMLPAVVAAVKVRGKLLGGRPLGVGRAWSLTSKQNGASTSATRRACPPRTGSRFQPSRPWNRMLLQRWAGPGQAQALSLCDWLFHRVESLQDVLPQLQSAGGEAQAACQHTRSPPALPRCLCSAAPHAQLSARRRPRAALCAEATGPTAAVSLQKRPSSSGRSVSCRLWRTRPTLCGSASLCSITAAGWTRTASSCLPRLRSGGSRRSRWVRRGGGRVRWSACRTGARPREVCNRARDFLTACC